MRTPGWILAASTCLLALLAGAASATVTWEDVADGAGIDFRTAGEMGAGPTGTWPAFPEVIGPGVCWADFDGDGYDDLYLVNQVYNAANPDVDEGWAAEADPHSQLYLNDGDGTFTDVSAQAGVDVRGWGQGCSAADYDADGYVDLFVAAFGDNFLFRNQGDGSFANVSAASGVDMPGACGEFLCWSVSSAWADYDDDGDLDLYVGNYVESTDTDLVRGPNNHVAQKNFLHRNNGDGTFTEVATQAGAAGEAVDGHTGSKTLGCMWFDYDLDGDMDILVANDNAHINLYKNQGDGTFMDSVAGNFDGVTEHSNMGISLADYDNDGYPDIAITHYQLEPIGFWWNAGDGTFLTYNGDFPEADDHVGWGVRFTDYDRDGDKDLMVVNGHTEPLFINFKAPRFVWRQDPGDEGGQPGDMNWVEVGDDSGSGITMETSGRGAAWSDYDFDGDVDFAVNNNGNDTANLLRASGNTNHWLLLALRQPGLNPQAIGARVTVVAGGTTQYREVQAGSSYASQDSLLLDFGLGASTQADTITVQWPNGGTSVVSNVAADNAVRIDRATGGVVDDILTPRTLAVLSSTPQNGWLRAPVDITISAQDRGVGFVSGIASTDYAFGSDPWAAYTGQTLPLAAEGVFPLAVRSTDLAGNVEPIRRTTVRIDTAAPQVSASVAGEPGDDGWFTEVPVTVTLDASDARSGIDEVRYRVDGGAWRIGTSLDLTEDGTHTVEYMATDLAGNQAGPFSLQVAIDHAGPVVALQDPRWGGIYLGGQRMADTGQGPAVVVAADPVQGVGGTTFAVGALATDLASGVRSVTFLLDGEVVAVDRQGPGYGFPWDTSTASSGFHTLEAIGLDRAGNVRSDSVDIVLVSASEGGLAQTLDQGPALPSAVGLGELRATPATASGPRLRAAPGL